MSKIQWTNPSVKQLSHDKDPIEAIVEKTRELILKAIDEGWNGPPYDPIMLAKHLNISVSPNEEISDARIIPKTTTPQIEYNPNRSKARIRFSLAHEIAHTLFPDYKKMIHHRSGPTQRSDDWQLELLCNISASEILMPVEPSSGLEHIPVKMENIIAIKKKYDVSTEAALLRMVKLTSQPITMFSAAKISDSQNAPYRIDYTINSATSSLILKSGLEISSDSVLSECTAIGFTARRKEKLFKELPQLDIECIGVSPYRNSINPRVLGIIKTKTEKTPLNEISYLVGDATEPRGKGHKIIAHIVNDASKRWGKGFGREISQKWPEVTKSFVSWCSKTNLNLGNIHTIQVSEDMTVFSMIAQHGYGKSVIPRIRYQHLALCLESLAEEALQKSASVHMPRIGTGFAGGDWKIIQELINKYLVRKGVDVTVYDLYGNEKPRSNQSILDYTVNELSTN